MPKGNFPDSEPLEKMVKMTAVSRRFGSLNVFVSQLLMVGFLYSFFKAHLKRKHFCTYTLVLYTDFQVKWLSSGKLPFRINYDHRNSDGATPGRARANALVEIPPPWLPPWHSIVVIIKLYRA